MIRSSRMATKQKMNAAGPGRPHTTIASIAAHMGLSRATVTHVLNGRAEEQRIRPETQRRVLDVARDLGYRANTSARAIRSGRFGNIGLVQSLLGQYLPRELLLGLMQAISDKEMHLVLSQVPDGVIDDESYLPHTMRELSVDGVLIYRHVGFSESFLDQIHRLRIPAVFLNTKQEFDAVHPDDLMGGRIATEFLLQLGHERIAYVDSEELIRSHYSRLDRRTGYELALSAVGKMPWVHTLPQEWKTPEQANIDQRVEAARLLLARDDRPTAVIAYELTEGMAVVHAAHDLRLRIPEDLSVIQFHNRIDDRYYKPIHTVSNVMEQMGRESVEMLTERMKNPEVALATRAVPVEILKGASCLPPRS